MVKLSLFRQGQTQIVAHFRLPQLEFERSPVRGGGIFQTVQRTVSTAEVGVGGKIIEIQRDRFPNPLDREVMASDLVRDKAEMMPRLGMIGLQREDLAVHGFRGRQPPGLVVLQGEREGLRYRKRGHAKEAANVD